MNQILILRALFHTVPMMTPGTKNLNQSFFPCAGDVVNRVDSCSVHPLHNSSADSQSQCWTLRQAKQTPEVPLSCPWWPATRLPHGWKKVQAPKASDLKTVDSLKHT